VRFRVSAPLPAEAIFDQLCAALDGIGGVTAVLRPAQPPLLDPRSRAPFRAALEAAASLVEPAPLPEKPP
jgi:hypothetical protein